MVALGVVSQDVVPAGHVPPCGGRVSPGFCSPRVEPAGNILDPAELSLEIRVHLLEAIEDDALWLNGVLYRLKQIRLRGRVGGGEDEHLEIAGHLRRRNTPCTWRCS